MQIARYYCPTAHETFSLLPDCLASRFPGDLDGIEQVVADAEAAPSIEAAANLARDDAITLTSAVRWMRRRLTLVRTTLLAVATLRPGLFGGSPRLCALRIALGTDRVLVLLRGRPDVPLMILPRPLGFGRRLITARRVRARRQQRMGADPDGGSG